MVGDGQICPGPGTTLCHADILTGVGYWDGTDRKKHFHCQLGKTGTAKSPSTPRRKRALNLVLGTLFAVEFERLNVKAELLKHSTKHQAQSTKDKVLSSSYSSWRALRLLATWRLFLSLNGKGKMKNGK
jgi:hypothetical protein